MKIIHTSDWHLGDSLNEHDRLPEQKAFLNWLLDVLKREKPDALLVSGDVYDTHTPSNAATEALFGFFSDVMAADLPTRIVMTAGNHDSPSVLRATSSVLERMGTIIVADSPEVSAAGSLVVPIPGPDGSPGLVVGAIPFLSPGHCSNASDDYSLERPERIRRGFSAYASAVLESCRTLASGAPVVLMAHCAIDGSRYSESEEGRRSALAGLETIGSAPVFRGDFFGDADYVALGHLHLPQVCGRETVRYSGSPLQMDFGETGEKHIVVAEFGPRHGDAVSVRCMPVEQTRPLVSVEGSETDVVAGVEKLVSDGSPALVRVRLGRYDGELDSIWRELETLTEKTGVRILSRGRLLSGGAKTVPAPSFSGPGVDELDVFDLARRRLSEANYNDIDIDRFIRALKEGLSA